MSDYLAEDNARQAAGLAPQAAPIYPVSAANARNAAIRQAVFGARVGATLPHIAFGFKGTQAKASPFSSGQANTDLDPLDALELYPQTINAEYLKPMSTEIDAAVAAGDLNQLRPYAERINPELAVGLMRRAAAAQSEVTPKLTTVNGAAGTNNSPADGATANTCTFTALDQNGSAMAGQALAITTTGTGVATPTNGSTDASGHLLVSITDTAAEDVTVTATSGAVNGTATVTFVAAS